MARNPGLCTYDSMMVAFSVLGRPGTVSGRMQKLILTVHLHHMQDELSAILNLGFSVAARAFLTVQYTHASCGGGCWRSGAPDPDPTTDTNLQCNGKAECIENKARKAGLSCLRECVTGIIQRSSRPLDGARMRLAAVLNVCLATRR